jgi:hypothetical protein
VQALGQVTVGQAAVQHQELAVRLEAVRVVLPAMAEALDKLAHSAGLRALGAKVLAVEAEVAQRWSAVLAAHCQLALVVLQINRSQYDCVVMEQALLALTGADMFP